MQQTLLLTLQGARQRLDLELPGDALVDELLPLLVQVCGDSRTDGRWALSRLATGQPLQAARTLFENRVLNGDVLILHPEGSPLAPQPTLRQEVPALPAQGSPILITWEK